MNVIDSKCIEISALNYYEVLDDCDWSNAYEFKNIQIIKTT
jgi:hypothetical protein